MDDKKRAMGFIDFENINIPARTQFKATKLDFNKLAGLMLKDYVRVGCTVYLPDKMRKLTTDISRQGLEPVLVSPGKSVDGRLILDLLVNAYQDTFDVAVIASGDRDYVKAVQAVQQRSKEVKIVTFQSNLGPGLSSVVKKENIQLLDSLVTEFVSKTFDYVCSECGTEFTLPFKLFPNQGKPKCFKCLHPGKFTKQI